jgi:hypothetical protein
MVRNVRIIVRNRSPRKEMETAERGFSARVSGYTRTDHVHSITIRSALQICAFEEKVQDYKN